MNEKDEARRQPDPEAEQIKQSDSNTHPDICNPSTEPTAIQGTTMNNAIEKFRQAIANSGITPPDEIEPDGRVHRFSSNGKHGDDAGWYFLFVDGTPAGRYGCWRQGSSESWSAKAHHEMTQAEKDAYKKRSAEIKELRNIDDQKRQEQARREVAEKWQSASTVTSHPYLTKKGVQSYDLRCHDTNLLIPMRDKHGVLQSIQSIAPDGGRKFHYGGIVKGCYFTIGKEFTSIVICEGYATGASIHEATGLAVVVAFTAGNLSAVAVEIREKYPEARVIVAADDDWITENNPGVTQAKAAACTIEGLLATPVFPADRGEKHTDFNDLHMLVGLEAVKRDIDAAETVLVQEGSMGVWAELLPLTTSYEPETYPLEALPSIVRDAIDEVFGFVKAPIPLIATSALAAMSLAIQAHVDVERAEGLTGPTSLFLIAIADSGERKSTCDGYFMKAIREFESKAQLDSKPLLREYRSAYEAWEMQRNGIKEKIKRGAKDSKQDPKLLNELKSLDDQEPKEPKVCRLTYSDITPEELARKLSLEWPSGGVVSSEAGTVLGGHSMEKSSAMRNMALLNQLWDGGVISVDRKTSVSFSVHGARLVMALQVQEAALRSFVDGSKGLARGIGFLARFLVSWPTSTQGNRLFTEPPKNWPKLEVFNERLNEILNIPLPIDESGGLQPKLLKFSDDAKKIWIALHDNIEILLSAHGELCDVRDVASKTADNAARLAAIFHVFSGGTGAIAADSMKSAGLIAVWHLYESRRFLGAMDLSPEQANMIAMEKWLIKRCKHDSLSSISVRSVQQNCPNKLRKKELTDSAIDSLVELGRVRRSKIDGSDAIEINPKLLGGSEL